ncbi:MAG: FCD domain-containing protein [Burkholderiales bacterium]
MQPFDKIRTRKTFEEVALRIRSAFIDGSLRPGDKLPSDEDLCARLGVSRSALREALRALEVAGVVDLRTGRHGGAYVSSGDPKVLSANMTDLLHLQSISMQQLTEARVLIEDQVVRLACERASAADLAALEANVVEAKALHREGRLDEKAARNIEFHNVLAAATKNPVLIIVMRTLTDVISAFQRVAGSETGTAVFLSRDRFMKAMHARDADAAVDEMNKNMRRIAKVYIRLARERQAP